MVELERQTSFDPRPESYRGFFDPEWANSLHAVTENSKLEEPAFDLIRNWHAASMARSLPLLMTECLRVAEEKAIQESEPLEPRKIRLFRQKLIGMLERRGVKIRSMFRKQVQNALEEIDSECDTALASAREAVVETRPNLWEAFLNQHDFIACLWSLERLCYSSLYYNYEWFLTECVRILRSEPDYRFRRHDDCKRDFRDAFGAELQQECWSAQGVVIARYARHALLHNGGRMTEDLRKQPHDLLVNGNEIQVGAPHTNTLFALLSTKVLKLAAVACKMGEFQK